MPSNYCKFILAFFIALFSFTQQASASHIVGVEMNYECLGNNQYNIILRVYRDCENGNPNAYFDDPVPLGVFDAQSGAYLWAESMSFSGIDDTVSNVYPDSCTGNFCIHATTYSKIITLPFTTSGYNIAYQRCCRSGIITNLANPQGNGMSVYTEITPTALTNCNNSPRFNRETPLLFTVNDTLNIQLDATDVEGDSIVYEMYTPFLGASTLNPAPSPPTGPPYIMTSYNAPHSSQDPFGGGLFSWDSQTGALSIAPPNLGVYVLGFSMLEYTSSGNLLSRTYKEIIVSTTTKSCIPMVLNQATIPLSTAFQVFPNPTNDQLFISTGDDLATTVQLYSLQGQLLQTTSFQKNTVLDVQNLPKGVYLLKVQRGKQWTVKQFVKE